MNDADDLDTDHAFDPPSWRATIRDGRLRLTNWAPWLISGGPLTTLLDARRHAGVAIVDLTVIGEDDGREIITRFHSDGRDLDAAEQMLTDWADSLGYRRIWLTDRVRELDGTSPADRRARVCCGSCRGYWSDGSPEFWAMVCGAGVFPLWCPACGCELEQWRVVRSARTAGAHAPGERASSQSRRADRNRQTPRSVPEPDTE